MTRDPNLIKLIAEAIANARGVRRGVPAITNILDVLPSQLRTEVTLDAKAVLDALENEPGGSAMTWPPTITTRPRPEVGESYLELTLGRCPPDQFDDESRCHLRVEASWTQLCGLYVPYPMRRQGLASILVNEAKRRSLAREAPLYVEANPFGVHPPTREKLVKWYTEKHGFQPVPGHPYAMIWDAVLT
jgi:hypothetical protein